MATPNWITKLQQRWQLRSVGQVIVVLIVFACTGFTILFLKPVITGWFVKDEPSTLFSVMYWILIFPVYNVFLLFYGFVFGQFKFFWEFEKRFFRRIIPRRKNET